MKVQTLTSIDAELKKKARAAQINLSNLLEDAINKKLNSAQVDVPNAENCEFCGREGKKETADTINQAMNGLTWLYPDEKWICNSCLRRKSL